MKLLFALFIAIFFIFNFAGAQNLLTNGDFESVGIDPWFEDAGSGADFSYEKLFMDGDSVLHLTLDSTTGTNWHLALINVFDVGVDSGYYYKWQATISASADVNVNIVMQQNQDSYSILGSSTIGLSTTAVTFTDSTAVYVDDHTPMRFSMQLGDVAEGTEIWIDDVSMTTSVIPPPPDVPTIDMPGVEILVNGGFEEGFPGGWATEAWNTTADFVITGEDPIVGDSSLAITVTGLSENTYEPQLKQEFTGVSGGSTYYTMFMAYASAVCSVEVVMQRAVSPWDYFGDAKFIELSTEPQVFRDTVYIEEDITDLCKFAFMMGYAPNLNQTIVVDHFSVIEHTPVMPLDIVIDAAKDAFYDGLTGPADGLLYMPAKTYLRDVGTPPDDNADMSGLVWFAYDTTNLYVYAELADDIVSVDNATTWQNDGIELKFDPDPNIIGTTDALQIRLTAHGEDDALETAGVDNINGDGHLVTASGDSTWAPTYDDYARAETADGYILEWRVPVEFINRPNSLRYFGDAGVGKVFGMVVNIADNDEVDRKHMLQWSSGHADVAWANPALHGSATMMAGNKLKLEAVSPQDGSQAQIIADSAASWYYDDFTVSIKSISDVPSAFSLKQNYPNPFNPTTRIRFNLDRVEEISLTVYDVTGAVVNKLISNQVQQAGTHEVTWNGKNDAGVNVASGIYFYKLAQGTNVATKKMMLIR